MIGDTTEIDFGGLRQLAGVGPTGNAREYKLTIAVMGCRVNGPGETDDADLGLWCGPNYVNLKRRSEELGQVPYEEILGRLRVELDALIAGRTATN